MTSKTGTMNATAERRVSPRLPRDKQPAAAGQPSRVAGIASRPRMAKRITFHARKLRPSRPVAAWLSWALTGGLGLLVLSFELTRTWTPPTGDLRMLLWAWSRRPTLVPLVVAMIAGPVLTLVAWRRRGPHRRAIVAVWVGALLWLGLRHGERIAVMLEVLWWRLQRI